jgi:hypothetical protein
MLYKNTTEEGPGGRPQDVHGLEVEGLERRLRAPDRLVERARHKRHLVRRRRDLRPGRCEAEKVQTNTAAPSAAQGDGWAVRGGRPTCEATPARKRTTRARAAESTARAASERRRTPARVLSMAHAPPAMPTTRSALPTASAACGREKDTFDDNERGKRG